MPQTAETNKKLVVTAAQYEGIFAPPPALPTLQKLFDWQVETLVEKFKGTGLAEYVHADPFRNRLTEVPDLRFLLVPAPPKALDLSMLMSLVELDGRTGVNYLNVNAITPAVEVPATASLLTGIEDGRGRLNIKPVVSRQNIADEGRHPYDVWRGIVHVVLFPMVLKHHYLDLVGSRLGSGFVPSLYVGDGRPALDCYFEGGAAPEWGAPSAQGVLAP